MAVTFTDGTSCFNVSLTKVNWTWDWLVPDPIIYMWINKLLILSSITYHKYSKPVWKTSQFRNFVRIDSERDVRGTSLWFTYSGGKKIVPDLYFLFKSLQYPFYFIFERHLVLPFNCILQKPLHFWKRRDNSNVQSFQPVFTIWIPPEKERERKKVKSYLNSSNLFIDASMWYSKAHVTKAWAQPAVS